MRTFRGLTLKTKRWVYGYYCEIEGQHFIIVKDAIHTWQGDSCCITGVKEVDPETVSQYIGKVMSGDVYTNSVVWFLWMGKKIKARIVDVDLFYHLESCEGERRGLPRTLCKSDMSHIEIDPELMESGK